MYRDDKEKKEHSIFREASFVREASSVHPKQKTFITDNNYPPGDSSSRSRPTKFPSCFDYETACSSRNTSYPDRSRGSHVRPPRRSLGEDRDERLENYNAYNHFQDKHLTQSNERMYRSDNFDTGTYEGKSKVTLSARATERRHQVRDIDTDGKLDLIPVLTSAVAAVNTNERGAVLPRATVKISSVLASPSILDVLNFDCGPTSDHTDGIGDDDECKQHFDVEKTCDTHRRVSTGVSFDHSLDNFRASHVPPRVHIEDPIPSEVPNLYIGNVSTKNPFSAITSSPEFSSVIGNTHSTDPRTCIVGESCVQKPAFESSGDGVIVGIQDNCVDIVNETTSVTVLTAPRASSCCSVSSVKTGGSSMVKSAFKVIYYQNRFISVPIGNRVGSSSEIGVPPMVVQCGVGGISPAVEDRKSMIKEHPSPVNQCDTQTRVGLVSVKGGGNTNNKKKRKSSSRIVYCLQRVVECLQDKDRTSVKHRRAVNNVEVPLAASHTTRLVKFLNICFMTTGLVLFFGVVLAITYTSVKKYFI